MSATPDRLKLLRDAARKLRAGQISASDALEVARHVRELRRQETAADRLEKRASTAASIGRARSAQRTRRP